MPVPLPTRSPARTDNNAAVFATHWLRPSTAVITARGDLDAANAAEFTEYTTRHTVHAEHLVLDLSGIDFLGTAGFFTLQALNARCAETGVDWTLVPSRAVARLLQICGPTPALPTRTTVATALAATGSAPLLHLVAQPR